MGQSVGLTWTDLGKDSEWKSLMVLAKLMLLIATVAPRKAHISCLILSGCGNTEFMEPVILSRGRCPSANL